VKIRVQKQNKEFKIHNYHSQLYSQINLYVFLLSHSFVAFKWIDINEYIEYLIY